MSHHHKIPLSDDDRFARGQIAAFAVLVAIAAIAALMRFVGILH
jgi:hypothetical protein